MREKRIYNICISYFLETLTNNNLNKLRKFRNILTQYGKLIEFHHNQNSAYFRLRDNVLTIQLR